VILLTYLKSFFLIIFLLHFKSTKNFRHRNLKSLSPHEISVRQKRITLAPCFFF
jgi:hypothetical protein